MKSSAFALLLSAILAMSFIAGTAGAEGTPIDRFDDPDAKAATTGSTNRVVIEAGDADAKASLRVARLFETGEKCKVEDPKSKECKIKEQRYGRYAFTVSAPFDRKKADKVDVGTLSGLTAGSSAALEIGALRWTKPSKEKQEAITADCEAAIPKLIPGYEWLQVGLLTSLNCNRDLLDKAALEAAVKQINAQAMTCAPCRRVKAAEPSRCEALRDTRQKHCAADDRATAPVCALLAAEDRRECAACQSGSDQDQATCNQLRGEAKLATDVDAILKQVASKIADRVIATSNPMQGFTLSVKANEQSFAFVTAEAPNVAQESTKTSYSGALAYTYVGRTMFWAAGYSYERSYDIADQVQVCNPLAMSESLSCEAASVGAPTREKKQLTFLESRWLVRAERFAVAPRVEFDMEKSDWAVRVPLYLVVNKDKELTAGIALGYSDAKKKDDRFGATLFISKAFSLLE